MTAICYQDGIYIYIDQDIKGEPVKQLRELPETLLYYFDGWNFKRDAILYGGRVRLSGYMEGKGNVSIDGIDLKNYATGNPWLPGQQIVDILNQIEQLGIDAVLEHYKTVLKNYKEELLEEEQKIRNTLASDVSDKDSLLFRLKIIKSILSNIVITLFSLYLHIPCGIELSRYNVAYNTIINNIMP